jgi:FkbM family methyltransferase
MFKQAIVNTSLGFFAQNLRDRLSLHRSVERARERLGEHANDSLARKLLERICAPGRVFIDVGSHIGSVIDGVRRSSRPAHIISIEAIPAKAEALQRRFPEITVHCCAAGDAETEAEFFVDDLRPGFSSLNPAISKREKGVRRIVVPVRRLDSVAADQPVDVIKIDVEGAELGVLRGAEAVVAAHRPTIMFESGAEEMAGFPKRELWEWCDAHDYCVLVPNRVAHQDDGMSLDVFMEAHLYPRRTTNYFAVARERRTEIRSRARVALGLD